MVIPELPPDIAELKERVGRFVADEVFPLEEKIATAGEIDFAAVDAVRKKARASSRSVGVSASGVGALTRLSAVRADSPRQAM